MRRASRPTDQNSARARKTRMVGPIALCVNECTELKTPERVMNVPRMVSRNVAITSVTVQPLSDALALGQERRVQRGGRGQPGQERRVLDRVPRPVPAPAQHLVGPPAAEHDRDREEDPRQQQPVAQRAEEVVAQAPGEQRRRGQAERDRHPDVAQVEERRVHDHEHVVLQQRVRARGRPAARASTLPKGCAGPAMQEAEERAAREPHGDGVRHVLGMKRAVRARSRPRRSRRGRVPRTGSTPRARTTGSPGRPSRAPSASPRGRRSSR